MERNRKILLAGIIVSTLVICGIIAGITIFFLNTNENEVDSYNFVKVIEGADVNKHAWGINMNGICDEGETLIFSFYTNPNGLLEVYLKVDDNNIDLLIAKNVDNYQIVMPEDGCALFFINLEAFNIILTLDFTVKIF